MKPVILALLILLPSCLIANDNDEMLAETTEFQEKYLLSKYRVIKHQLLEQRCLDLARKMQFKKIIQCQIINSNQINAYVLANGHVYFSLGLMKQIKNNHQWAAILAHENAHLELNHYIKMLEKYQNPGIFFPKSKIKKMHRLHEKQADENSYQKLSRYGYDTNQIYYFMQRVIKLNGNKKTYSHIKPSKRVKKSINPEIKDEELVQSINDL